LISQFTNATRLSCGFGVVLNLMNVARLELNYTLPLWKQTQDRFVKLFKIKILLICFLLELSKVFNSVLDLHLFKIHRITEQTSFSILNLFVCHFFLFETDM